MRTVRDPRGVTWICLELPEVPASHVAAAASHPPGTVAIECNSGAERVVALVPAGWDESLDDRALAQVIAAGM